MLQDFGSNRGIETTLQAWLVLAKVAMNFWLECRIQIEHGVAGNEGLNAAANHAISGAHLEDVALHAGDEISQHEEMTGPSVEVQARQVAALA
jgi:hypothetical protein